MKALLIALACFGGQIKDDLGRCHCPPGYLLHRDHIGGKPVCFEAPINSTVPNPEEGKK